MREEQKTYEALVRIRIRATSKMEASSKLRVMFLSSAIGPRDTEIDDFHVIEE